MKIELCTMTRHHNPADFIEWVKWHINLGFDRITIIDNSSDYSLTDEAFKQLSDDEINKIFISERPGNNIYQMSVFSEHLNWTNADWVMYLDDDEFLWFDRKQYNNVHDFLQFYINKNNKKMEALALYWQFISSKEPLQNRTTTQLETFHDVFDYKHHNIKEIKQRTLVKSFFKKSACKYRHDTHYPKCKNVYDIFNRNISKHEYDDNMVFSNDTPCVLHYYYKTLDEWIRKHRQRDMSKAGRIYPGSEKTDEELTKEYYDYIKYFTDQKIL